MTESLSVPDQRRGAEIRDRPAWGAAALDSPARHAVACTLSRASLVKRHLTIREDLR